MDSWFPTNAVAWYGAIVATGSLLLGYLNYRRERTVLRVTADTNMLSTAWDGPMIVIRVANIGRRTVHLAGLPYLTAKGMKGGYVIEGEWNPSNKVDEGQSAVFLCEQTGLDLGSLRRVVVKDEAGRLWKGRIKLN
jgi:hypothetical protein